MTGVAKIFAATGADFPLFAFSHCRDVVAVVSRAGGFGVLGANTFTSDRLDEELRWIDDNIGGRPYGVDTLAEGGNASARALMTYYVGQGVGLIDSIQSAGAVVQAFRAD